MRDIISMVTHVRRATKPFYKPIYRSANSLFNALDYNNLLLKDILLTEQLHWISRYHFERSVSRIALGQCACVRACLRVWLFVK